MSEPEEPKPICLIVSTPNRIQCVLKSLYKESDKTPPIDFNSMLKDFFKGGSHLSVLKMDIDIKQTAMGSKISIDTIYKSKPGNETPSILSTMRNLVPRLSRRGSESESVLPLEIGLTSANNDRFGGRNECRMILYIVVCGETTSQYFSSDKRLKRYKESSTNNNYLPLRQEDIIDSTIDRINGNLGDKSIEHLFTSDMISTRETMKHLCTGTNSIKLKDVEKMSIIVVPCSHEITSSDSCDREWTSSIESGNMVSNDTRDPFKCSRKFTVDWSYYNTLYENDNSTRQLYWGLPFSYMTSENICDDDGDFISIINEIVKPNSGVKLTGMRSKSEKKAAAEAKAKAAAEAKAKAAEAAKTRIGPLEKIDKITGRYKQDATLYIEHLLDLVSGMYQYNTLKGEPNVDKPITPEEKIQNANLVKLEAKIKELEEDSKIINVGKSFISTTPRKPTTSEELVSLTNKYKEISDPLATLLTKYTSQKNELEAKESPDFFMNGSTERDDKVKEYETKKKDIETIIAGLEPISDNIIQSRRTIKGARRQSIRVPRTPSRLGEEHFISIGGRVTRRKKSRRKKSTRKKSRRKKSTRKKSRHKRLTRKKSSSKK